MTSRKPHVFHNGLYGNRSVHWYFEKNLKYNRCTESSERLSPIHQRGAPWTTQSCVWDTVKHPPSCSECVRTARPRGSRPPGAVARPPQLLQDAQCGSAPWTQEATARAWVWPSLRETPAPTVPPLPSTEETRRRRQVWLSRKAQATEGENPSQR